MLKVLVLLGCFFTFSFRMWGDVPVDTIRLDEVVVTGTHLQVNRNQLPYTVSVIDRSQIEQSGETALLSVLSARIPGLFVTERGMTGFGVATGAAGAINIRGIGSSPNTQVLVLIDGHPQFMGIMGHPLPDAYVSSDAERVEVIRGPASTLYGSNAMGGVINIITRKQRQEGVNGQAQVMYGSYNTQKYMVNGGFKKKKFSGFASLNHDRTDGHRKNSAFHITNGFAKFGYEANEHFRVNADVSIAQFRSENPGLVDAPSKDWVKILRGMASVSAENSYEKTNGALTFFYNFGHHRLSDGYVSDDRNYGLMLYQGARLFQGNVVTAGFDYKNYGGEATNLSGLDVDKKIDEVAGYLLVQQSFWKNRFSLNGGIRYEYNGVYGGQWIPQAGVAYRPLEKTTLKFAVAKGFRSPTMKELYMFPPQNDALRPEHVLNYELSVLQFLFSQRMSLELTGFIADGDNIIQTDITDGKPKMQNSGSFKNKGVEIGWSWMMLKNLDLTANYSYLHMKTPVIGAPEQKLFAGITWTPVRKLTLGAQAQWVKGLYTAVAKTEAQECYFLLNARATYRPCRRMEIFVSGDNLLDRGYEINYKYPMPGATVMGGVKFNL